MEMLIMNNYKLHKPDKKKLKSLGFHYNVNLSNSENDFYSITFPVLQYNNKTTVNGTIDIDMNSGEVFINACDINKGINYAPFYKSECSEIYEPIITKINKAFNHMFEKFNIKKESN